MYRHISIDKDGIIFPTKMLNSVMATMGAILYKKQNSSTISSISPTISLWCLPFYKKSKHKPVVIYILPLLEVN